MNWNSDGNDNDNDDFSWESDDDEKVNRARMPGEACEAGPSQPSLYSHFTAMGFSKDMVEKAIKENGEGNSEAILETLLTYSAIESPLENKEKRIAEALRRLWAEVRELGLGSSGELDCLDSAPSPLQFLRDHVSANRPCIISRSATGHWPAIARSLWTDDDYLCDTLRSQTVSVHLTPNGRADSVVPLPKSESESEEELLCFATPCVQKMRFPEALRLISSPSSSLASVAYAQQQNDCFRGEYSALAADVEPHIPWATEAFDSLPEAINLWIGNSESQTSFHKDHYENLYVVITGEKHFLLLPPTDLHRLYIRPYPAAQYIVSPEKGELILELENPQRQVPWCSVDPFPSSLDAMARQLASFPLYFNGPKPFECTIKAGEILYLPSMWFHHVRQTPDLNGRTIAINYWYDMQFDIKYAYFNFLQSFNLCPSTYSMTSLIDSEVDDQSQ